MGPDTCLCVPRAGSPHVPPSPSPRPAKTVPAEGTGSGLSTAATAPSPAPGRTARGKKLFRYFSTFLTYLVKAADALIRIMNNVGASEHSAAALGWGKAELPVHPLLIPVVLLVPALPKVPAPLLTPAPTTG